MKYWVFNEEQLADALYEHAAQRSPSHGDQAEFIADVSAFLESEPVQRRAMIRGHSETPQGGEP